MKYILFYNIIMCKNNNWPKHRPMSAEHLARGIYNDMCIEYNC